jgi:hypothetical protein
MPRVSVSCFGGRPFRPPQAPLRRIWALSALDGERIPRVADCNWPDSRSNGARDELHVVHPVHLRGSRLNSFSVLLVRLSGTQRGCVMPGRRFSSAGYTPKTHLHQHLGMFCYAFPADREASNVLKLSYARVSRSSRQPLSQQLREWTPEARHSAGEFGRDRVTACLVLPIAVDISFR